MTVNATDIVVLSLCALLGNVGVAITGFGMAILYLFVFQVAVLARYDGSDLKFAIFMQALSLLVVQPQLLWKAQISKHASRPIILLFIPATLISTPLGQLAEEYMPVQVVQAVIGTVVALVAILEIYRGRARLLQLVRCGRPNELPSIADGPVEATPAQDDEGNKQSPLEPLPTLDRPRGAGRFPGQGGRRSEPGPHRKSIRDRTGADSAYDPRAPVFFMIGSQRSGSNWLRTMLNEREDLAGPHPPHILRDFMPLLGKFGDLNQSARLYVLAHHVCTFVERNQVTWTDVHDRPLKFDRMRAYCHACDKVEMMRRGLAEGESLEGAYYLLAIFDFVMTAFATANHKRTWICKSMGMSKYHRELLAFYGPTRLRYIYLVRDPRDVAMSFMKTPVGDCHYYSIVSKWCKLQSLVIPILRDSPALIKEVRYEALLTRKEQVLEELYAFMGERHFGQLLRLGSVQVMSTAAEQADGAKKGAAAQKAAVLSYQFKNLTRGNSFARLQLKKWLQGDEPLTHDEILLIESVAHETMTSLGYELHVLGTSVPPTVFTEADVAEFGRLNELAIQAMDDKLPTCILCAPCTVYFVLQAMNDKLLAEDPGDAKRRIHQAEVLSMPPTLFDYAHPEAEGFDQRAIAATRAFDTHHSAEQKAYPYDWPLGALEVGYLTPEQVQQRLTEVAEQTFPLPNGGRVRWAAVSQRGYYPLTPDKANQDAFATIVPVPGKEGQAWFGVYDGHGATGDACAAFAKERIAAEFFARTREAVPAGEDGLRAALEAAHEAADAALHESEIDDALSGSTAASVFLDGERLYVSNVGDSRIILGSAREDAPHEDAAAPLRATALSSDHTPYVCAERKRIERCGGRVCSTTQLDGLEPMHQEWAKGDGKAPPRVWAKGKLRQPGCAFTRSIGDSLASKVGVIATPTLTQTTLAPSDRVLMVVSDGISDFLSDEEALEIARLYLDPLEACRALVGKAYEFWIGTEDRADDITVILLFIEPPALLTARRDSVQRERERQSTLATERSLCLERSVQLERLAEASMTRPRALSSAASKASVRELVEAAEQVAIDAVTIEVEGGALCCSWGNEAIGVRGRVFAVLMGATSGFLGGLCGIRGPPMILFFLHAQRFGFAFTKASQRANAAAVTLCNVVMRVVYYGVRSANRGSTDLAAADWPLYVSVALCSCGGVAIGQLIFQRLKDSQATIKALLSFLLLISGVSLLITAFGST